MANETVLFKRGDSATITSTPVTDGQILFDTSGNGKMYLDNGTDRLEMGGAITVDASLSKTSTNAIQNKAVTGNILNSLAEVSAATQQNTIAGALALKEVNNSLNSVLSSKLLASGAGNFTVDISKYKIIMLVSYNTSNGNQAGTGLYLKDLIQSGSSLYSPVAGTTNFCNCGFNTLTSITMETNMTGIIPKLYGIK